MRRSRLTEGGTNLFQKIKEKCRQAEAEGKKIHRLSIGQPQGPALDSARRAAGQAVMCSDQAMHEYQDNGSPGVPGFAESFVQFHAKKNLKNVDVAYLPVPGIKSTLKQVILACSSDCEDGLVISHMTDPGYPTPRDQCWYLGKKDLAFATNPENKFLPDVKEIDEDSALLMFNFPHNPSGQIATREYWEKICAFCEKKDIRIWNDAAYIALSHTSESCALTDAAVNFPELSWAEGFSASKLIGNGTGWRIGAVVGSPDFVADIATIKGNDDSGFVAPMAAGVLASIMNDTWSINGVKETYRQRLELLIGILTSHGMRLAVEPKAGFFTLWLVPKKAFGQDIKDAEHFNFLMIEKTGIVGVHFHPYIRYAVVCNIQAMAKVIDSAFKEAAVSY